MLNIIGLAYRANCLVYGVDAASEVVNTKKARLIITAEDASSKLKEKAARMPERCNGDYTEVPIDSETLGGILGVQTCSIAVFTDVGFAASFTEKLKAHDPTRYTDLSENFQAQKLRAIKRKEKKMRQK